MISKHQIEKLGSFSSASWAIWSNNFDEPNSIEAQSENIFLFMIESSARLKSNIVFLGLNPSREITYPFRNFHTVKHKGDKTLKSYIQDETLNNLLGGYMTDITAKEINPIGSQVKISERELKDFDKQLEILGEKAFKIICFGNDAFDSLCGSKNCVFEKLDLNIKKIKTNFQGKSLEVFGVRHYSNRGYNNQFVKQLKEQLAYLNKIFGHNPTTRKNIINSSKAPEPVGLYPHARRVGNLLFLSGVGPRERGAKKIPGVDLNENGEIVAYDIETQCRSVFQNVRYILEESGSSWDKIVDVTVFLTNMKDDFQTYNRIYAEYFAENQPCRTTVEINCLPTPIAIELKVIATID